MNGETVMVSSELKRRSRTGKILTALCLCLSACAATEPVPAPVAGSPLLMAPNVLTGAPLFVSPGPPLTGLTRPASPVPMPATPSYLTFLAPTVVAARNNAMYIADSGRHQIFRYDSAYMALSRFSDQPAGSVTAFAVGSDMSLYVADFDTARVLHFSWDGRLLQSFSSDMAMSRPVGILLNEAGAQVLVADNLYNHVIIFNTLGRPIGTLKSLHTRSLAAMAGGPDGLYLVDRLSRAVVVMGLDGFDRYVLGGSVLKDPMTIAVDSFNRVYVGDAFDNSIKVFANGELAAVYGAGQGGLSFNRITSLFIEHDVLYVADSLNRRILTFRIAPPASEGPAHE